MWNKRSTFVLYFLALSVSVRCPVLDYDFYQNFPFQLAPEDEVYEDVDPEMMRYWKDGGIDPRRDAVYERFFSLARNCFRYVSTYDAYRDAYPEKFTNDEDNAEILRRAQISAVFYACENVIGVVISYYQVLQNDRRPLPEFIREI